MSQKVKNSKVNMEDRSYDYVYQYKDHLGNVRLNYAQGPNGLIIKEENNYYPFGLKHKGYNDIPPAGTRDHKYGFGGKEEQDELGLEWHDFHARNYDASLGRWMNVDPLAEETLDAYGYTWNSPIYLKDPTGMSGESFQDDYGFKDGKITFLKKTEDKYDKIVYTDKEGKAKTNRKGESIAKIDKIAKGILKVGQDFKNNAVPIALGGEHKLTEDGVYDFAYKLSSFLDKEIGGTFYGYNGAADATHVMIGKYVMNNSSSTKDFGANPRGFGDNATEVFKYKRTKQFHVHPDQGDTYSMSPDDRRQRDRLLKREPNIKFYIIARSRNQGELFEKIDYTKWRY